MTIIFTHQSLHQMPFLILVVLFTHFRETRSLSLLVFSTRPECSMMKVSPLPQLKRPVAVDDSGINYKFTSLLIKTDESAGDEEDANDEPFFESPNKRITKKASDETQKKRRSGLLTLPLFVKFMAVLFIKVLTDAVVFPSLFLYRILRRIKRKIIGLFQQNQTEQ